MQFYLHILNMVISCLFIRMVAKISEVYEKIDGMAENLQAAYDSGIVEGYTAESSPYSVQRWKKIHSISF